MIFQKVFNIYQEFGFELNKMIFFLMKARPNFFELNEEFYRITVNLNFRKI